MGMMPQITRYMIDDLLYGADETIGKWVGERIKELHSPDWGPFTSIGIVQNNKIVGGCVFNLYRKHPGGADITVNVALDPACRVTRKMLKRIFDYPFGQLGCSRLTSYVAKSNKVARRFNERTSWKLEGVKRKGYGRHDLLMFGMLSTECPFWKKPQ